MNNKANQTSFKKGHKHSKEILEKMSIAKKGKRVSLKTEFKKGTTPWNKGLKGIHLSPNTEFKKGSTPPNKGKGLGNENELQRHREEYKLWRKSCFERDNFTCQKYGTRGGRIIVHHINNFADFPELRLAIDNGITLSEKAHKEFHKIYGRKNNTREQLLEFLNTK